VKQGESPVEALLSLKVTVQCLCTKV